MLSASRRHLHPHRLPYGAGELGSCQPFRRCLPKAPHHRFSSPTLPWSNCHPLSPDQGLKRAATEPLLRKAGATRNPNITGSSSELEKKRRIWQTPHHHPRPPRTSAKLYVPQDPTYVVITSIAFTSSSK
nr:unnamed protein product [Digitaria exilis]